MLVKRFGQKRLVVGLFFFTLPALRNLDCRNDANITSLAEILQPFAEACGEIS